MSKLTTAKKIIAYSILFMGCISPAFATKASYSKNQLSKTLSTSNCTIYNVDTLSTEKLAEDIKLGLSHTKFTFNFNNGSNFNTNNLIDMVQKKADRSDRTVSYEKKDHSIDFFVSLNN